MPTSNGYPPFEIVIVPFPYADRLAEKRRPALVVSSPALEQIGFVWLVMITSAKNRPLPGDVIVPEDAGMPAPSVVRPAKIACVDPGRILDRLGQLDAATAELVAAQISGFLALTVTRTRNPRAD